jgi:hypothetical protein
MLSSQQGCPCSLLFFLVPYFGFNLLHGPCVHVGITMICPEDFCVGSSSISGGLWLLLIVWWSISTVPSFPSRTGNHHWTLFLSPVHRRQSVIQKMSSLPQKSSGDAQSLSKTWSVSSVPVAEKNEESSKQDTQTGAK